MMGSIVRINSCLVILSILVLFSFLGVGICDTLGDTLGVGEVMKDWQFLASSNGLFRLLFFIAGGSSNRYLGIQFTGHYDTYPNIVWVANRENPLNDTSGVLNMTQDGNLVIADDSGFSLTINNATQHPAAASSNTSLTLLDSGNLVLRAGNQMVWQSFDYPTDTLLSGMKLGMSIDLNTGRPRNRVLTSWLSPQVAAPGAFTLGVDPNNTKQLAIWQRGVLYWLSGIWNGYNFTYLPDNPDDLFNTLFNFTYISNEKESYFTLTTSTCVDHSYNRIWITMNSSGLFLLFGAVANDTWGTTQKVPCNYDRWEAWSKACVLPEPPECRHGDVFIQVQGYINSSDIYYLENYNLGLSDCREMCVRNCSCNVYASLNPDGTGCSLSSVLLEPDDLSSIGDSLYIRNNADSPSPSPSPYSHPRKRRQWLTVGAPVVSVVVLSVVSILCCLRWKHYCFGERNGSSQDDISQNTEILMYQAGTSLAALEELSGAHKSELREKKGRELLLFKFSSIEISTDHFSDANKLGQGGFGPVYKGKLVQGQEIAVKRLSKNSRQGLEEFKNEVVLISKLQHRNLVRLLGCCIQGEERILIYEYLPNKSLDSFLFDATKQSLLDWKRRLCIIEGIAQGLLYLHKYSRLKIIHRDLKTSNILLDNDMNPKISDFGTARIFEENESRANTNRIVGTYGYMSPEYAMDGLFSVKSDIFSFGVMMLEIISGKKNTGFYQPNRPLNLLGHAWDLYKEGRCLELMDPAVEETCSRNEVMRYVEVGLLCVQESAADRPTMSDIVFMLSSESMTLPAPKQPAFSAIVGVNDANLSENLVPHSINDATITEMGGR